MTASARNIGSITFSDRVVLQPPVERPDELGGGEVPHLVTGVDSGVAEGYEGVVLAVPGGPTKQEPLLGPQPLEAGQVLEGGPRDRRGGEIELGQELLHGRLAAFSGPATMERPGLVTKATCYSRANRNDAPYRHCL